MEFVGAQGVILGIADIPDQEEGEQARRFRVRWGGGVDAAAALQVLANQLGEQVLALRRAPDTYVIGKPASQDMEARVFYVTGQRAEDYTQLIRALLGESAQVAAFGDTLVVRDTPAGMRVVEELFESLNAARGQWVVEVRFLEISDTAAQALGMDLEAIGTASLELSGSLGGMTITDIITARLEGLIQADAAEEHVRTLTTTRLHVIEGHQAQLQVGSTIPVPISTTENIERGLVTRDFEEVDTGVLLKVAVRTEPDGRLRVMMQPEISEITGFVEDRPIRSRRRVDTAGVLEPGGTLIAGGFYQDKRRASADGLPGLLTSKLTARHEKETDRSRIYIMLRIVDPDQTPLDQGNPQTSQGERADSHAARRSHSFHNLLEREEGLQMHMAVVDYYMSR